MVSFDNGIQKAPNVDELQPQGLCAGGYPIPIKYLPYWGPRKGNRSNTKPFFFNEESNLVGGLNPSEKY